MLTSSEQLYEEQKRMFGNPDGTFRDLEYEEVKNMPVMDSCIREALRLVSGYTTAPTSSFTLPHLSVFYYIYHFIPHPFARWRR
jgi:sterol 14-demethylase